MREGIEPKEDKIPSVPKNRFKKKGELMLLGKANHTLGATAEKTIECPGSEIAGEKKQIILENVFSLGYI